MAHLTMRIAYSRSGMNSKTVCAVSYHEAKARRSYGFAKAHPHSPAKQKTEADKN